MICGKIDVQERGGRGGRVREGCQGAFSDRVGRGGGIQRGRVSKAQTTTAPEGEKTPASDAFGGLASSSDNNNNKLGKKIFSPPASVASRATPRIPRAPGWQKARRTCNQEEKV